MLTRDKSDTYILYTLTRYDIVSIHHTLTNQNGNITYRITMELVHPLTLIKPLYKNSKVTHKGDVS